jgi:hypothetical protein
MKQQAGQVMQSRPQAKQLAVQHVGKPGDWMPVLGVVLGKSPDNTLFVKACKYLWIFVNQEIVIQVYEVVGGQLMKYYKSRKN